MRICVFCSAKSDFSQDMLDVCRAFARWMGEQGHSLVYGGARVGLMGIVADEVLKAGGRVEGYMPKNLFPQEIPHRGLHKMVEVADLMERKKQMMDNSDCFVVLPGGVGTLDEFFEVLTWKSLDCFDKPIYIFNLNGFWDSLIHMMKDLSDKKVLTDNLMGCFKTCDNIESLQEQLC